jgi:PAS domain S-box-containing protein
MTEDNPPSDKLADLRWRAEKLLRQQSGVYANLTPEEIKRLVHELQVHQIELEMQNEELRQTQQDLEESRDRYADLYDFAPVGYFTVSDKGLILKANLTGANMVGLNRGDLLKQPFSRFITRNSADQFFLHLRRVFSTQTQQTCELKMLTPGGKQFDAQLVSIAQQNSAGKLSQSLNAVVDITARVQAEEVLQAGKRQLEQTLIDLQKMQERLVQQERLAAVGQLAAGIAHDFNNILTSILGFAQLIEMSPETPESVRLKLVQIITPGQRAAHLVQQILDFSRKSVRQPQPLDLAVFILESIKFFKRTIPENIHIAVKIEPEEYQLTADPTQLQQMLTNLVINARDAMPSGGTLTIGLSRHTFETYNVLPCDDPEMSPGDWLKLTLADTGAGIPAEALPHIFEPFFTTKEVGQGTGLGLAQVYGIVRQYEGCIDVSSQVDKGATFAIYLPFRKIKELPMVAPPVEIPHGSGETILLVEDEPAVLEAVKMMLTHLNYRVLTANNGKEALAVYARQKADIALVLADMVMPGMDGSNLLQRLKALAPSVRVVMMSGYPLGEKAPKSLVDEVAGWLPKPMSVFQLAQIVSKNL